MATSGIGVSCLNSYWCAAVELLEYLTVTSVFISVFNVFHVFYYNSLFITRLYQFVRGHS